MHMIAHPVVAQAPPRTRIAYAAAHVVADPLAAIDPILGGAIDWGERWPTGAIYGRSAWGSPKRWTPRSVVWA